MIFPSRACGELLAAIFASVHAFRALWHGFPCRKGRVNLTAQHISDMDNGEVVWHLCLLHLVGRPEHPLKSAGRILDRARLAIACTAGRLHCSVLCMRMSAMKMDCP